MNSHAVDLSDLSVAYGDDVIFSDMKINIGRGEFVSFLGPSGCGKSTILRIIGNLTSPKTGSVRVLDAESADAWRHLAYVFQAPRLVPWRDALDNVVLGMQLRGLAGSRSALRAKAIESMRTIGIEHLAKRAAHVLSGGEQQRVAIARALAVEPEILLMDEPFSALDVQTRHELREEIVALWERTGITTVFVTHDVDEAILVSSRIIVFSPKPTQILADLEVKLGGDDGPTSAAFEQLRHTIVAKFQGAAFEEISEVQL
jgi:NitT/TauT family transport system ATP-binding protein